MSDDLDDLIVDGASDLLEFAFDQVTDNELLKDIPVFGFFVKIAKAGMTVRDRLFLRKVQLFFLALPKIEDEKKVRFQAIVFRSNVLYAHLFYHQKAHPRADATYLTINALSGIIIGCSLPSCRIYLTLRSR